MGVFWEQRLHQVSQYMQICYNGIVFTWQIDFAMFSEVVQYKIFLESKYAAPIHFILIFRIEPSMKSFSHANNNVLRRDIYIHSTSNS